MIPELRYWSRNLVREFGFLGRHYGDTGATYSETHALLELGRIGSLEVGELAKILNVDKSVASRILSSMQKKSWVKIKKTADGRKRKYLLSKKGKKVLEQVDDYADEKVSKAILELSESDQLTIKEGIALYSKALKKSRIKQEFNVRQIKPEDDLAIAKIVRKSLKDLGFEGPGTAAVDETLNSLSQLFEQESSVYMVAEQDGKVFGGAGIMPLEGGNRKTCELVRMFISPQVRGKGLGQVLIEDLLRQASKFGYKYCYLETREAMQSAQRLYLNNGFEHLKERMGNTGHFTCNVLMGRKL